jgi:hypothetical protein
MEKKGSATVGGTGFVSMLQVAFIVLKLCKVIDWKWVWVLAPLWMSALFTVGILFVVLVIYFIRNWRE